MARYRALGWKGSGDDAVKRIGNKMWAANMKKQRELKMGMKNNQLLRGHIRPQVVF